MRVLMPPEPSDDDVIAAHVVFPPGSRPRDRHSCASTSSSDGGTAIAGVSGGLGNRDATRCSPHCASAADGRGWRPWSRSNEAPDNEGLQVLASRTSPATPSSSHRGAGRSRSGGRGARTPGCDGAAVRNRRARRSPLVTHLDGQDRARGRAADRGGYARARARRRVLPHRRPDGDLRRSRRASCTRPRRRRDTVATATRVLRRRRVTCSCVTRRA